MSTTTEPTLLEHLRAKREKLFSEWDEATTAREGERAPFEARIESDEFKALDKEARDAEVEAFRSAEAEFKTRKDELKAEIGELDERIADQEDIVRRRDEAAQASRGKVEIKSEALTYRADNGGGSSGLSYYRDLALAELGVSLQTGGTRDQALERLNRHSREMATEMPKRAREVAQRAQQQIADAEADRLLSLSHQTRNARLERIAEEVRAGLPYNPFETRVEPNLTQGQGGWFVPPLWLVDQWIPGLRAHLIAAGLPRQMDLPAGTDSINIPKLANLTSVGYQQVNNSGLPSTDWTDTAVTANVKTLGGYSDVALQLLEQSPHGIVDEVITTDLMAAYNKFLDGEVIAGDGTNAGTLNGGHLLGIYPSTNWTGTNSVTYTDATPTGQHFAAVFGAMASNVAKTRFDVANYASVVHGRRWFGYASSLDANGRPLGETQAGGPFNVAAALQDGLQAEGLVGRLPHVANSPVYIDDNIPTTDNTDGGGATRDIAIGGLWDDAWLFKGALRTDVFREVLSGSLGVRFRLYNYAAFLLRYGQSFAVATGSGFAPPTGVFAGSVSSITF